MKDQMEMSFGRAETRDPVSGNDVPPGSLPKEVRDDIPARLSEGEYVVPADVVRYYGVKFFEDLRDQAKMGLQQMDADGRIGGEPIEPQQGLTEADLAGLEQMLVTGVAEGGLMDKIAYTAQNDPLVNQRINGMGMEVGFASGGMAQSLFSDPTKIDQIISQVTALAQQKPEIMQELAKRGISITRTNAQVQPQQMQKQNSPAQTTNPVVNAAEGVLATGEFNPNRFRTVGGTYFEPETYNPDFGVKPPTPVSVPTDAAAAPVEPAGGCGRGMMWNGQMCVVDPNYRYEESEGPDPEPSSSTTTEKKAWFEQDEDFFTNPLDYIEKQLARGEYKKEAMIAGVLMPGLGLAAGLANKIDDLNGIAKARAAYDINVALGNIDPKETKQLKRRLDSLGNDLLASGTQYKNSFAIDYGFNSFEDAISSSTAFSDKYKSRPPIGADANIHTRDSGDIYGVGSIGGLTNKELLLRKQEQRQRHKELEATGKIRNLAIQTPAQQAAGQSADNDRTGDDEDRYDYAKTGTTTVKDSTGKTVTRDTYDTEKVKEQAKKDAAAGNRRPGRATGGLVQRRKKK